MLAVGGWAGRPWRKAHCLAARLLRARPVLPHGALFSKSRTDIPTPCPHPWSPGCTLDLIFWPTLWAHPPK